MSQGEFKIVGLLWTILALSGTALSQAPEGFRWVNLKEGGSTVLRIQQALKSEDYTALREVGIFGDYALVMTSRRDADQPTPLGDQWNVYNISTKTWNIASLIVGYNLEIKDWIDFQSGAMPDLGIVYLNCWECEPASLFTALHYDQQNGWRSRWVNNDNAKQPGIVLRLTDVGDPYTNEDVDQVFAVVAPHNGVASAGTWYHSRDLGSGKITDIVSRFSVDPKSGGDKSEILEGAAAQSWKQRLCTATDSLSDLLGGQSSSICKRIAMRKHHAGNK